MAQSKTIEYTSDPNKFDLIVHRWDTQGRPVGKPNHYRKFILGDKEVYERPLNSGNLWYENNEPAGRVELEFNDRGHIIKKEFKWGAEHIEYVAPLTGDAKVAAELASQKARADQLEAELKAIKAEQSKKVEKPEAVVKKEAVTKDGQKYGQ